MSYIEYFLFSIYFLIMKFSVAPESIIVLFFFPLILILMCSCVILIKTTFLLTEVIPQYFFWLLPSEKFNSFSVSSEDISNNCSTSRPDKILYIFYVRSESHNYPLYRIVTVFVCNLWFIFSISLVSIND